ncbi:MAG: PDZ domain-containing protein [Actinomycetota bacterium]|nr:MAG: PDZ domain-containing protein [Actinomycetota bacterium]
MDTNDSQPNENPETAETGNGESPGSDEAHNNTAEATEPSVPGMTGNTNEPEAVANSDLSAGEQTPVEATQEIYRPGDEDNSDFEPSIPKPFPAPDYPLSGSGNGTPNRKRIWKGRKPLSPLSKAVAAAAIVSLILGGSAGAVVAKLTSSNSQPTTTPSVSNSSIDATPTDIQGILSKVEPAVVDIQTTGTITQGGIFGGAQQFQGAGTGMIMTSNGEVLTNNHVIADASTIKVQLFNQTKLYNATVIGTDPSHDVAVIKIQGLSNLPTVTFGKSSSLQVGDSVVAVGNALALQGLPTVTQGIVSGLHRSISTSPNGISSGSTTLTDMIQTDAPINPGNSGGPLVNSAGQVIGMNTAIIASTGSEPTQNLGFAEAIDSVLPVVKQIETHPSSGTTPATGGRAFLGVNIENLTPQIAAQLGLPSSLTGALVVDVVPGSPAGGAGLTAGSVITKVDNTKVTSASQLVTAIQQKKPGNKVTIYWTNSNGNGSAVVTLGSAPTA